MKLNWDSTNIKDLFDFHYGKGLPKRIRDEGGIFNVYGSNGKIGQHSKPLTSGPTIIIGRKGSVGEVHLSNDPCWPIDTTYYIDNFPCQIPPSYWSLFLKSLRLDQLDKSSAIPGVSRSDIYKLEVPFPPLEEQRRIVTKLEKLLAKVDRCKERLEKIPTILKRFRQSVLTGACSGELTTDWREKNPDSKAPSKLIEKIKIEWERSYQESCKKAKKEGKRKPTLPKKPKSEEPDNIECPQSWGLLLSYYLFSFVTSGSRGWAKYYSKDGPLFIRVGNLNHDTISLDLSSVQKVRPPKGMEGIRTRIYPNDLLISITAETGMIALIQKGIGEAYINQHVALARPIDGFSIKYLAWFLASKLGKSQFSNLQRGMTKSGLGLTDIRSIWVPFPPISEQVEITRRIEALFKIADQIETRYKKAKVHVENLAQSILSKAFSGELVPQDPNDEPASVLLERIRNERKLAEIDYSKRRRTPAKKSRRNVKRKSKTKISRFSTLKAYKALSENAKQLLLRIEETMVDREFSIEDINTLTNFERETLKDAFFEILNPSKEKDEGSPFIKMKFFKKKDGYVYKLVKGE